MCDRAADNVCFTAVTPTTAAAVFSEANTAVTGTVLGTAGTTLFSVVLYADDSAWSTFLA